MRIWDVALYNYFLISLVFTCILGVIFRKRILKHLRFSLISIVLVAIGLSGFNSLLHFLNFFGYFGGEVIIKKAESNAYEIIFCGYIFPVAASIVYFFVLRATLNKGGEGKQ